MIYRYKRCWLKKSWIALSKIWKSNLSRYIKVCLFQAIVESVLLYGAETWTITSKIQKSLDGCYQDAQSCSQWQLEWEYGKLRTIWWSSPPWKLKDQRFQFAVHCLRSNKKIVSSLVLWISRHGLRKPGRPPTTYVDVLGKDTGLTTDELATTMKDRGVWKAIIGVHTRST